MFCNQSKIESDNWCAALLVPTTQLGFEYNLEIADWNSGLNGFRVFDNGHKEEIEGNLGLDLQILNGYSDDAAWLNQIPDHYQSQTIDFPDLEFFMLWLAANSPKAAQILMCRPLILVLICRACATDKYRALALCEKGQREILNELGFDSSKAALKFIDKLKLTYQTGLELSYVERYLGVAKKEFLRFKHYAVINDLVLCVDRTLPMLTGTKLGMLLSQDKKKNVWNQIGLVKDTIRLGDDLNIGRVRQIIGQLNSIEELKALHDRWMEQRIVNRSIRPDDANIPYPVVQCNLDSRLVQIKNYDELLAESSTQIHCIVSYHSSLANGQYYAFIMEYPERVTIGVRARSQGPVRFEIEQIKCKRNSEPSEETKKLVYQIFRQLG